jgi:hypothetical protein
LALFFSKKIGGEKQRRIGGCAAFSLVYFFGRRPCHPLWVSFLGWARLPAVSAAPLASFKINRASGKGSLHYSHVVCFGKHFV